MPTSSAPRLDEEQVSDDSWSYIQGGFDTLLYDYVSNLDFDSFRRIFCPHYLFEANRDCTPCLRFFRHIRVPKRPFVEKYALQSGVVDLEPSTNLTETTNQDVDVDENPVTTNFNSSNLMCDVEIDNSYSDYLSRTVKIGTYSWSTADAKYAKLSCTAITVTDVNPRVWTQMLSHPAIVHKIDHFAFFRADLVLDLVIDASPFLYGAGLFTYYPCVSGAPKDILDDTTYGGHYILQTQPPHVIIYPGDEQQYSLRIPFIWPYNMVRLQSIADVNDLGYFEFQVMDKMESTNGNAATTTITIMGHFENVVLSGSSCGIALQSGKIRVAPKNPNFQQKRSVPQNQVVPEENDEFDQGPLEKISSTVGKVGDTVDSLGLPFGGVISKVANTASKIFHVLGFTNTPNIENVSGFRNVNMPDMATCGVGYPENRLAVDPKNELTMDPKTVNLGDENQLSIHSLVTREVWLYEFVYASTSAINDCLFNTYVTPMCNRRIGGGGADTVIYHTPMSFVGSLFKYWRGTVIFRFKAVCNHFHRGRLLIQYDPYGTAADNLGTNTNAITNVFSHILDLSKDTEATIEIPFQQYRSWCLANAGTYFDANDTTPTTTPSTAANGVLTVKVLNAIVSQEAAPSIYVHVFIQGGDDLEFAYPYIEENASRWVHQSGRVKFGSTIPYESNTVYMGERIVDLRALLHRKTLNSVRTGVLTDIDANYRYYYAMDRRPITYGYDTGGLNKARNLANNADKAFNWVAPTFIDYISSAFVGYRGSINWTVAVASSNNVAGQLAISRTALYTHGGGLITWGTLTADTTVNSSAWYLSKVLTWNSDTPGQTGTAQSVVSTQPTVSVNVPMYSTMKFFYNRKSTTTVWETLDESKNNGLFVECTLFPNSSATDEPIVAFYNYCSAGFDYDLVFFRNVPTMYAYEYTPAFVNS